MSLAVGWGGVKMCDLEILTVVATGIHVSQTGLVYFSSATAKTDFEETW